MENYQDVITCGTCNKQFSDITEFLFHRVLHPNDSCDYCCYFCKKVFAFQESLFSHYKSYHKIGLSRQKNENVPTSRRANFSTVNSCEDEIPTTHIEIISKTPLQNYKVNGPEDFYFLLQTEVIKGRSLEYKKICFKCLYCEFKSFSKWSLCAHMKDCHRDIIGVNQNILLGENLNDDKQKLLSMFTYDTEYENPSQDKRGRKPLKRSRRSEKQKRSGIYPCNTCGKVFNHLRYLKKHIEIHCPEKKFACENCGKKFKSKTYLSVHQRTHRDKTFHCIQCDFVSTISTAIHAHRQLHSQGSVLCDICGFAYTDKATLIKHMRVHDPQRPFSCSYAECTWKFKTEAMCKAHIRAHTMVGKFKCSICGYVFRHKHHLIRHEIKMHGLNIPVRISSQYNDEVERSVSVMVSAETQLHLQPLSDDLIDVSDCSNANVLDSISHINVPFDSVEQTNEKADFLNVSDNLHDTSQILDSELGSDN